MNAPAKLFFTILFILFNLSSFAQSLPVGSPLLEETFRRMQIKGEGDSNNSFTVRPVHAFAGLSFDSIYNPDNLLGHSINDSPFTFLKGKGKLNLLPVTFKQQYNTHHPYGWNDGSMIQARGYQNQLAFGFYSTIGPLSIQIQPELVYAQNSSFSTFSVDFSDSIWKSYYYTLNRIDNPERYGGKSYLKLFPGQSSVRFNFKKLSFGLSSENLWWGPGVRNSLIMSNNAPGFKHITFNTTSPILSSIGSFEWQVVSGLLKNSGILPPDTSRTFDGVKLYEPKKDNSRYLNGMIITWQPKWTKGLFLGFTRAFYQYEDNVHHSLNGYLPIITALFKKNAQDENQYGRDQLLSVFFRLILPKDKAEVYGEFGRNDHSQNFRDLLLEPEHARAYIIGARKIFTQKNQKDVELFMELTNLQYPLTINLREQEGWYTHYQVRQGYTNLGQVMGAGIGPGGSSQTIGLNWLKGIGKTGVFFERVVWNNDFYYNAFQPSRDFGRHWVDLSLNLNKSWQHNHFIYDADFSLIRSLNYQWKHNIDVTNLHANLSISYLF